MSYSLWQYHRNIEINITDNCHFVFVYLLGKLDYSLYEREPAIYAKPAKPFII